MKGDAASFEQRAGQDLASGSLPPCGGGSRPNHALRAADRAYLLRDGTRVAEGAVASVLPRTQLEALYQAPVETLTDTATGASAFLPG